MTTGNPDPQLPRVAVIGCGYWGKNLVRVLHEIGSLGCLNDADMARASEMALAYHVQAVDQDCILSDPSVDAVVIAAPAAEHATLARRVLDAGKHVFVEKPLALHRSEAEELCRQAEKSGCVLMVGHLLQYHPAFVRLRSLVDGGTIGRIEYIYSNRLNLGKIRREEDILWSFAPHDISMILSLVRHEPDSVLAIGGRFLHKGIADMTTTHLSFPGGEVAHIFVSWLHPYKEQKLVVVGDSGMLVFDDGVPWDAKLTLYRHRINWREGIPEPAKAEAEAVEVDPAEPLQVELEHFLDCIQTGGRPLTDGEEAVRVLSVLNRATESMDAYRRTVVLNSDVTEPATVADQSLIHSSAYIDNGSQIGAGTRVWHFCHILTGSRIGRECSLGQNVVVGPNVTIGNRCKLQNNVSVYDGVTLEDDVFCGPSCVFTNVAIPRAEVDSRNSFQATLVRRGATIGANATIVCGHEIGEYAFIAAGAVVTTDVPSYGLMAGVPARRIGWISRAGDRLGEDLVCKRSGRRYILSAPDRLEEIED